MKINFSPPDITQEEIDEVVDTLQSGWITTGPKTKKLEEELAAFIGTPRLSCLNSATFAMEMVLRYLGVGPGDEVITCAYTYTATASVVDHVGANIVLVDSAKDSRLIDYDAVEAAITEKTKAIIPVHLGGVMVDVPRLIEICEKKKALFQAANDRQKIWNRVLVLADGAHALGASRGGFNCGQDADFTCFSFHAVKNFTTAEGGAVTWRPMEGLDNDALYHEFMLLSLHGQDKDALAKTKAGAWKYDIIYPGYKGNMTDIMASLGLAQLKRYPNLLKRRHEIIQQYDEALGKLDYVKIYPHRFKDMTSSGHLYMVNLKGFTEEMRNRVIQLMDEAGIATNVHYQPLPLLTAYKNLGFDIKDYPNAYDSYVNTITLPLHTLLTQEQIDYLLVEFEASCQKVLNEQTAN